MKINEISPDDSKFTEVLGGIALTPKMLYFCGKMLDFRAKTVAIVGSRKPTAWGRDFAYDLARELASYGICVVSGLAYGVDAAAHEGALAGGGVTVAVLGTPLGDIYPAGNQGLARQIVNRGGVVMSEYRDRVESGRESRARFVERNRLISGLADVVVVVEAAERSGSLSTARHAKKQGRKVLAVPGRLTDRMSAGCNALLASGEATACRSAEDVLRLIDISPSLVLSARRGQTKMAFYENELQGRIGGVLTDSMMSTDEIVGALGAPVSSVAGELAMMEVAGLVVRVGEKWRLG